MGLDMKTKKKICGKIYKQYQNQNPKHDKQAGKLQGENQR